MKSILIDISLLILTCAVMLPLFILVILLGGPARLNRELQRGYAT